MGRAYAERGGLKTTDHAMRGGLELLRLWSVAGLNIFFRNLCWAGLLWVSAKQSFNFLFT